jgi:hypothetical protein
LLADATGENAAAIRHFEEAIELEEQIGALPYLAHSLGALAAELDAADRAGDGAAAARLEAERQALVDELSRAAGLAGRNRLGSLEAERARVNVTRTLRAVIERIAPAAPSAAAHLRVSVKTGASCRYEPAPGGPSRWHV